MKPICDAAEEAMEAIAAAAKAAGHTVKGVACPNPDCPGCRFLARLRERQEAKPPPRNRDPGEEG